MILPFNEYYVVLQTGSLIFTVFQESRHSYFIYTLMIILLILQLMLWYLSRCKNIKYTYWFSWINFTRIALALASKSNVLKATSEPYVIYATYLLMHIAIVKWIILQFILEKNKFIINTFIFVILTLLVYNRCIGFGNY